MTDKPLNTSTFIWDLTGEMRIVNTNKMNFCLDSTDRFLNNKYGKVIVYKRGAQKNQIWKIANSSINNNKIITDNSNRRLASDKNGSVGAMSFFPENDLMFNWVIEQRVSEIDKIGFVCGEVYIKNAYNNKYLTLRDDNDIILSDLTENNKGQIWFLFENKRIYHDVQSSHCVASPIEKMADRSRYQFLKRTWINEQRKQEFTITNIRTSGVDDLDYEWVIFYSEASAAYSMESFRNRLISRDGYAMVYLENKYYDDQYWFIDLIPGYKDLYIITNIHDGKILNATRVDGGKTIVKNYTLFSTESNNNSQFWALKDFWLIG